MARFNDLPDDLVVEILARLPVDLLMRFKCVQKSWYSLIASPKFIVKQLCNQIYNRNSSVLLKCKFCSDAAQEVNLLPFIYGQEENVLSFLSFDKKTERSLGDDHASVFWKFVHLPIFKDSRFVYIVGHCHGIICLTSDDSSAIVLANPSIREFRELPQSHNSPSHRSPSFHTFCIGFGYDPRSNDYKIVHFGLPVGHDVDYSINSFDIYTLSTDSWRELNNIEHLEARIAFLPNFECLYFNGACYWIVFGYFDGSKFFILSFDMSDEVFRNIRLPNFSSNTSEEPWNPSMSNTSSVGTWKLMVFNESLAFSSYDVSENTFEIWVMDGFDSNGTWKKQLATRPISRVAWPLVLWKNDELIFEDKEGMVCSYNLHTEDIKDIPLQNHVPQYSGVSYMSSLVSVKGGNKLDIECLNLIDETLPLI